MLISLKIDIVKKREDAFPYKYQDEDDIVENYEETYI